MMFIDFCLRMCYPGFDLKLFSILLTFLKFFSYEELFRKAWIQLD